MRGISTAATGVIVALGPSGCFSEQGVESAPTFGGAVAVTNGFLPGVGGATTATATSSGGTSSESHLGTALGGFDADAVLGAAGFGGAAGATGRGGAPPEPSIPEGAIFAGGWDDNVNFDWFTQREAPSDSDLDALLELDANVVADAQELAQSTASPHTLIDVALVLDTTGSMGDELAYLEREFENLWHEVQQT